MSQENNSGLVAEFLSRNNIMIIDTAASARKSLAAVLVSLGGDRAKMTLVSSMNSAREHLALKPYEIIFSDFEVGDESGLDLIIEQKKQFSDQKIDGSFFVLVTSNASQSTVARAAEEDVDAFIIKPYSINKFSQFLNIAVKDKLFPSKYLQMIEEGKAKLIELKTDEAIVLFEKAKTMSKSPTLACFYLGQSQQIKSLLDGAVGEYSEGLTHNNIHYKCLIGLFETLVKMKNYEDAYEVVRRLADYFPANPKRLTSVLRLAIVTKNYNDIERYYPIFLQMDKRDEELISYMCSALVVTGKHYFTNNMRKRGMELFESAAISAAGRARFLLYIIETLVDFDSTEKELADFYRRLALASPDSNELAAAEFLLMVKEKEKRIDAIQMGRTLIKKGVSIPCVYYWLIRLSLLENYKESAKEYKNAALARWPDKVELFTF